MDLEGSSSPSNYLLSTSNASKRGGKKTTRHPSYRGVRRRNSGKWVSEVRDPNTRSRIWLGTFPNPEMAAVAHDVAVLALHGEGAAQLNFPGSAHRLPRAASPSHEDIQRAALQAATDFNPSSSSTSFTSSSHINAGEMIINVEETPVAGEAEFVDEEAIFNMPLHLDCMAEGMLLTPPSMKRGFNWTRDDDDNDEQMDFTLWG
ncbi:hypothetical protein C2S53_007352 [Perilla frutescens var. hirtella]|uniref:AP2/ERF domain-containing protein n=1 Tax=Perilla frutescens var. hirtella TaxID=608512 RepID=A0AAD4PF13_PERFH|nr:hypothetical protein C2S53_007352 [Perilla frutescens var. hirtella]